MKQYALLFACLFFLCVGSKAQEQPTRWTLRACLDYALEHNIQVKKSKVSHLSGIEDTKQAKAQLFPSLSASVTQGFVNYPSSDAATNNSYSGNYALNAKWTLFDGNVYRRSSNRKYKIPSMSWVSSKTRMISKSP